MQVAWQAYEPISGHARRMPAERERRSAGEALGASFQAPGCAGKPSECLCGGCSGVLKGLSGAIFQSTRKILTRGLEFSAQDVRGGPRRPQESPGSLPRVVLGALPLDDGEAFGSDFSIHA